MEATVEDIVRADHIPAKDILDETAEEITDGWTKWAADCEAFTKLVSAGYAIGEAVDIVAEELAGAQEVIKGIGLSVPGLIIGSAIGIIVALSSAYVHRKRNLHNQPQKKASASPKRKHHSPGHSPCCDHDSDCAHNHEELIHEHHGRHVHSHSDEHDHGEAAHEHDDSHNHDHGDGNHGGQKHEDDQAIRPVTPDSPVLKHHNSECEHNHDDHHHALSSGEEVAFAGDVVSHILGFSTSFTFLFNLAFSSPTIGLKLLVQVLAIVASAGAAVADVRSCRKNLVEGTSNGGCSHNHGHSGQADNWNNWTTFVDACSDTTSTAYWAADIVESITNLILVDLLGASKLSMVFLSFSWPALIIGAIAGVMALGAVYSHRMLAIHDDGLPLSEKANNISLTINQKMSLAGDAIAHTSEVAAPLDFVYEIATNVLDMPGWAKPLVQCVSTFFGATSAVADVRTCRNTMLKQNAAASESPKVVML